MDLLSTIRKEGSRGGRGDFKWSDVQTSAHRENYLGHSLMAPVGRWQKNRDLGWYAKGDKDSEAGNATNETAEERAARERKEEIKRVKEAEQDAMARALGFDVPQKRPGNANLEPVGNGGERKAMERTVKEEMGEDETDNAKGIGFGGYNGGADAQENVEERMEGTSHEDGQTRRYGAQRPREARRDDRDDYRGERWRRRRSPSRSRSPHKSHQSRRDRDRDRDRTHDRVDGRESRAFHRHRSPDRDHRHRREDRHGVDRDIPRPASQDRYNSRFDRRSHHRPRGLDHSERHGDDRYARRPRSRSRSKNRYDRDVRRRHRSRSRSRSAPSKDRERRPSRRYD